MTTTGKVTKLCSDPPGFTVQTDPGPPPVLVAFTPVTDRQLAVAAAAYGKGSDVEVEGTPGAVTRVTAK